MDSLVSVCAGISAFVFLAFGFRLALRADGSCESVHCVATGIIGLGWSLGARAVLTAPITVLADEGARSMVLLSQWITLIMGSAFLARGAMRATTGDPDLLRGQMRRNSLLFFLSSLLFIISGNWQIAAGAALVNSVILLALTAWWGRSGGGGYKSKSHWLFLALCTAGLSAAQIWRDPKAIGWYLGLCVPAWCLYRLGLLLQDAQPIPA